MKIWGRFPYFSYSKAYSYDPLNRLTGVMRGVLEEDRFSYDAVGNRLTDIEARGYTYNNANELLNYGAGVGQGFSLAYDANGNMISKTNNCGTTSYQFDTENRLIGINGFTINCSLFTADYKYDPFGRRIEKTVNGVITRYVYDREDILFELDASGNIITEYVHGPGIDEPIAMTKNNQTYYYHADGLGSIIAITDSAGQVVQRYEYNSFGEITYIQDPNFVQPYTYTGREYDEESGLYYYRARYYDAKVGRFLQKDPSLTLSGNPNIPFLLHRQLRTPQELNPFIYVKGNPVKHTDPTGLKGGLGGPLHLIDVIYDSAKKALEGAKAAWEGMDSIARDDYNFWKQTGEHKYEHFKDVNWDEYGNDFDEAYKEYAKERLKKKPWWCPL